MALDRNVLYTAGGMGLLLTGSKLAALSMFSKGVWGLEKKWRQKHPDVASGLEARWSEAIRFYDATHQNAMNRKLHRIGIPMIVGGAAGLLLSRPLRPTWGVAALAFTAGWALNFVGHAIEKSTPAFADDPLSFLAGPVWDLQQARGQRPKVVPLVAEPSVTLN
ncbi:MAG: DUF962 domain-containing protein [Deltaproteobacteria bacterium]|nr:DUF962 domain-containing protein [Deltaproteobacteria bacterium]